MQGIRGVGYEYAFSYLPQETQAEILLKSAVKNSDILETAKPRKELNYLPEVIWKPFDNATEKQREDAKAKLAPLHKLDDLVRHNVALMIALDTIAHEFNVAKGSLKRWYYKVRSFERSDWLHCCWINITPKKRAKKRIPPKRVKPLKRIISATNARNSAVVTNGENAPPVKTAGQSSRQAALNAKLNVTCRNWCRCNCAKAIMP